MWSVWCRALVGGLLVALGASLELYDQQPNEDLMYLDDNDIDTGPVRVPLSRGSDVVMRKLIRAMQLQRLSDIGLPDRPHLSPMEEVERHMDHVLIPEMTHLKDPVFKRLPEASGGPATTHRTLNPGRPQQKWKIKKGKTLGSQLVCYFKLCAFRSPA